MPAEAEPGTRVWDAVGGHLEEFARAWEAGGPPEVRDFVPADPPEVRRLVLVELVKLDLDARLRRGAPRPLEEYAAAFPELADGGGPPCDLLYEEFHLRRQSGGDPDPADYYRRFPGRAAELARLLGATARTHSTSARPAPLPPDLDPGGRLDDFDLLAVLGRGQFGKVFLARQRSMHRLVALKVSAARGAEAQTLAQLDHPHVVRVYDQRFLPDPGLLLVYMPYLPGGTLADVLDRVRDTDPGRRTGLLLPDAVAAALGRRGEVGPSPAARARWAGLTWAAAVCTLGAKLAAALDYAHRRGVLHRDVKPANVLLAADGEPLLADFHVGSCSKVEGAGPAAFFGGSLAYMAAEHLEAFDPAHPRPPEGVDGRADVFGLAVTLWELVTGRRPFGPERLGGNWSDTLAVLARVRRAGPDPGEVAAFPGGDVPGFKDVLLRCLDADPGRRPDAGEMARELELCLRPATRELVRPDPGGWRGFAVRHPLTMIYPPAVAVNALASLFNITYNRSEIIDHWPGAEAVFERIVTLVNGVLFPLAMLLVGLAAWPVRRGMRRVRAGDPPGPDELADLRVRALRLGSVTAGVCVAGWVLAGVVWPVAVRAAAGPPPSGAGTYLHFGLSLAVCGLIAAAYPYFVVNFLAVRVFYPALLGPSGPAAADGPALRRAERDLARYRAVAAAVPLLTVALVAWADLANRGAVVVLSAAGLAGVGLASLIEVRTRADLAALAVIPTGTDQSGAS